MFIVLGRLVFSLAIVLVTILWAMALEGPLRIHEDVALRRLLGYAGVVALLLSFLYSLRKRKTMITAGSIPAWLTVHEILNVAGSFIVFLHSGCHGHALVPFTVFVIMLVSFVSGVVGRYIYQQAKGGLVAEKERLQAKGLSDKEIGDQLALLAMASRALGRWREIHMPMVFALFFFIIYHVLSVAYFGGF